MPIAFDLTGGEKADTSKFEILMAIVADKGYGSKANRTAARKQSVVPVIPCRSTATKIPKVFGKALYRAQVHIEQAIGRLQRFKPIVPRCEKTKQNFGSFVAIAAAFILVKSVHTT